MPVSAQTVLRFENIDRISYRAGSGSLSFYEKKDSLYRQVFPRFDGIIKNGSVLPRKTGTWQAPQALFKPGDSILEVNDLKSYTTRSLYRRLSQYQYRTTEVNNGDTIYSMLSLFNTGKALIHETAYYKNQPNDSSAVIPEHDFYVKDFVFLQLRDNRYIVLYQNDEGYLIPTPSGMRIFISEFAFDRLPLRQQKADAGWKLQDDLVKQMVQNTGLHNNNYYIDYTDDNKEILTDNFGVQLLPGAYDRIKRTKYFILATRDHKTAAYNIFLEPLAAGIRSYTLDAYFPELVYLLQDDTLSVMNYRGQRNPKKQYLPDLNSDRSYSTPCYHSPVSSVYRDFQTDQQEHALYLHTRFSDAENHYRSYIQRNKVLLPGAAKPEDVILVRNNTTVIRSGKEEQWLIIRLKNRYGLYSVSFPRQQADEDTVVARNRQKNGYTYTGTSLACKMLLPPFMDSISRFDDRDNLQLLISSDGLKGIYPIHTEPEYRYLGQPRLGFVRFELAKGIKGWLNLQSQEEFTDRASQGSQHPSRHKGPTRASH